MRETRAHREEIADGVSAGYAEAKILVKEWRGGPQRTWRPQPAGLSGASLDSWVDRMATRYPGQVS